MCAKFLICGYSLVFIQILIKSIFDLLRHIYTLILGKKSCGRPCSAHVSNISWKYIPLPLTIVHVYRVVYAETYRTHKMPAGISKLHHVCCIAAHYIQTYMKLITKSLDISIHASIPCHSTPSPLPKNTHTHTHTLYTRRVYMYTRVKQPANPTHPEITFN